MANIDFHTHIFPVRTLPEIAKPWVQKWARPFSEFFHRTQPLIRHLPAPLRGGLDAVGGLGTLPHFLVEAGASDLLSAMARSDIDRAVVIAHPPFASNELILQVCSEHSELFPVVNVDPNESSPVKKLREYHQKGARALKIHAPTDGLDLNSPHYKKLLTTATDLHLPVILHTGCLHLPVVYKEPSHGEVENLEPWFKKFPSTVFILAHMNFHFPERAIALAEKYPLLNLDTSWQPAETISEAVRRIGSERILFASDWPLGGNNLAIARKRVQECVDHGMITKEDESRILGENAAEILQLKG